MSETDPDDEPYENTLSTEQLRREVRRSLDLERDLRRALKELPEVPPYRVLLFLSSAGRFPQDWEQGKRMQMERRDNAIPYKTECEIGAGLWYRIREALKEPSACTPPSRP